ncbi:hypothetical protein TRFO_41578 [Tritrichomonas foetus]|uniref:Uncharacterized protein n=1 Tax=Tritrichomonas foetus TaxID=1144522 RepID=A0A1J4KZT7_9EUKA|nr:hypothetical protein TRFO_41578 [Tritrichomonas foetus]|eukprot:OHT16767.1 hypothetical protein TRFO_41578 [Tritrichomonas foetus]
MILFLFTFCRDQSDHFFAFYKPPSSINHHIDTSISKISQKVQDNDIVHIVDPEIPKEMGKLFLDLISVLSQKSISFVGMPTTITLNSSCNLFLKNSNISFVNFTFISSENCFLNFTDSSISFSRTNFIDSFIDQFCDQSTKLPFFSLKNCTASFTNINYEDGRRTFLLADSSILNSENLTFTKYDFDGSVINIYRSSFECNHTKLENSNISNFIFLNNSIFLLSNFHSLDSINNHALISSSDSNTFMKTGFFSNSVGTFFDVANDSSIHMSLFRIINHKSEKSPLFLASQSSIGIFEFAMTDSSINSLSKAKSCQSYIFSNSSITRSISIGPLFTLEETNSEISIFAAFSLISESEICLITAANCDYVKATTLHIRGLLSRKPESIAFAFNDVSSAYLDELYYIGNGIPLFILNTTNAVLANSYIAENNIASFPQNLQYCALNNDYNEKNDYIENKNCAGRKVKGCPTTALMVLLPESSAHIIRSDFVDNQVEDGCIILAAKAFSYFMRANFTGNNAPLTFVMSEAKFSRSFFEEKINENEKRNSPMIDAAASQINIHRCFFTQKAPNNTINNNTSSKNDLSTNATKSESGKNAMLNNKVNEQDSIVVARNGTTIILNTTIVNITQFLNVDSSDVKVTLDSGRFDVSFEDSIKVKHSGAKVILLDTLFNCNVLCEALDSDQHEAIEDEVNINEIQQIDMQRSIIDQMYNDNHTIQQESNLPFLISGNMKISANTISIPDPGEPKKYQQNLQKSVKKNGTPFQMMNKNQNATLMKPITGSPTSTIASQTASPIPSSLPTRTSSNNVRSSHTKSATQSDSPKDYKKERNDMINSNTLSKTEKEKDKLKSSAFEIFNNTIEMLCNKTNAIVIITVSIPFFVFFSIIIYFFRNKAFRIALIEKFTKKGKFQL